MDKQTIDRYKRQVVDEWTDPLVAAGYRKWDRHEAEWGAALNELIVARASLSPGLQVLDIGSAHGEPGFRIAQEVAPGGRVLLTDIAGTLPQIAEQRATRDGIENISTQEADTHDLPFQDESFDRVTSRLTAMYFVERRKAFREALRVLKPGGIAVFWFGGRSTSRCSPK